jgi:hypothetical protein
VRDAIARQCTPVAARWLDARWLDAPWLDAPWLDALDVEV